MFNKLLLLSLSTIFKILISPMYWVAVILLSFQYSRFYKIEKKILGINKTPILKHIIFSSFMGLIGGLIASLIIISLKISIRIDEFKYIVILALILMVINVRFICFSYSAGIISLFSLIFGFPKINVSNVLAIVAILHIVESFLIYLDGDKLKIPVFIEKDGTIVGGFNLMRFWPLPIAVLIIANTESLSGNSLLNSNSYKHIVYLVTGVVAALGYGDISISNYPDVKIKKSSKNLFLYSIILLILSIISKNHIIFKYIASVFSPLGHELLIQYGKRIELKGNPVYKPSNTGVKVLDVIPGGIGSKIGIKTGDILLSINDINVHSKNDINNILFNSHEFIHINYIDRDGKKISKNFYDNKKESKGLGILIIPKQSVYSFQINKNEGLLFKLYSNIKGKFKKY